MCQFIETICIKNGVVQNILLHQQRMGNTQQYFFSKNTMNELLSLIKVPYNLEKLALIKCRIIYSNQILNIEYEEYLPKKINSLQIINTDISAPLMNHPPP